MRYLVMGLFLSTLGCGVIDAATNAKSDGSIVVNTGACDEDNVGNRCDEVNACSFDESCEPTRDAFSNCSAATRLANEVASAGTLMITEVPVFDNSTLAANEEGIGIATFEIVLKNNNALVTDFDPDSIRYFERSAEAEVDGVFTNANNVLFACAGGVGPSCPIRNRSGDDSIQLQIENQVADQSFSDLAFHVQIGNDVSNTVCLYASDENESSAF